MTPKEIRSRRIALGLTVQQLAHELGLETSALEGIEDGRRNAPPHRELLAVFERLEMQPFQLQRGPTRDCLIVEDDEPVRQFFAKRLRDAGCTVDEARDGIEALDATALRDYRLLLLDLRLPNLSGAEVLERVTKKPEPRPSVVVISGAEAAVVREVAGHSAVSAIVKKAYAIENAEIIFEALARLAMADA
ncbi:MAG TPA: response regulator [Thermoanaerobaculia bacterium]